LTFRVNHNIPALNSHRSLQANHVNLSKNLERLSSGVKINRAVDGPAAFMISEHMRSQVAGLGQAIDNSEIAVSMIQTTDANMGEVSNLLREMRQLAIHAANEGPNNPHTLEADQFEIDNILETIAGVADKAEFGEVKLLDGSLEATGTTTGDDLEFVGANLTTGDSRENGFAVKITQLSTKTSHTGSTVITQEMIDAGETLTVVENGKSAVYKANKDDTADTVMKNLQSAIDSQGIDVKVSYEEGGGMKVDHKQYGSDYHFQVSSSTAGVLSAEPGGLTTATVGEDIHGTINGESATGSGQTLTGVSGSKCVDGLSVRYYGEGKDVFFEEPCLTADLVDESAEGEQAEKLTPEGSEGGMEVGRVYVSQNSTKFHIGGNKLQTVGLSIKSVDPSTLATNNINDSGFESLADVDVRTFDGAQDAISVIDQAIDEVTANRAELGAFQKNTLESNLSNVRIANENLISSESVIRDTDMAKEMASFTKNQIMSQASTAMLAQANQMPEKVLQLLA